MDSMTYREAKAYMEQVQKRGSIFGLAPVKMLLERLGSPQNRLKVIHVAGTNGKGSICTFLEQLYRAEGRRVGRYISPTLHCYLERFQINGKYMEEEEFARLLSEVIPVIDEMKRDGAELPTAFEIETVIAFLYFFKHQVDIVILETGMGGREDATNVVDKPLCTVFGSIGMDHMQFLGNTIEKIAYEKAGIMKAGCPAVSYPNSPEVMAVLKTQFSLHNVNDREGNRFDVVSETDIQVLEETLEGSLFRYKGEEYRIRMAGEYQIYNAATAIETKLLLDGHLKKEALAAAAWEGRFEKVSEHPLLIRDGEFDKMMQVLCPLAAKVFTVTPDNPRGLPGTVLRESVLPFCNDVTACGSVDEALSRAEQEYRQFEKQGESAAIVAWGSLSYIGRIKGQE